jgi:hypothetical protein
MSPAFTWLRRGKPRLPHRHFFAAFVFRRGPITGQHTQTQFDFAFALGNFRVTFTI